MNIISVLLVLEQVLGETGRAGAVDGSYLVSSIPRVHLSYVRFILRALSFILNHFEQESSSSSTCILLYRTRPSAAQDLLKTMNGYFQKKQISHTHEPEKELQDGSRLSSFHWAHSF